MANKTDFIDKLHDLREVIHLLEMASQAIEATEDRGAFQRGVHVALGILADLEEGIAEPLRSA